MSCNNNNFLEDLKKKLDEIEFPEIDLSDAKAALSQVDSAVAEAQSKVNETLENVEGFLNDAIQEADKSLQQLFEDLQNSSTLQELEAKIKEIREDFGDAVEDLEEYIETYTGGISKFLDGVTSDFDSDINTIQDNIEDFLRGTFNFPNPCTGSIEDQGPGTAQTFAADPIPRFVRKPNGTVVSEPLEPVAPASAPASPPPKKEEAVNVIKVQNESDKDKILGRASRVAVEYGIRSADLIRQKELRGEGIPSFDGNIPDDVVQVILPVIRKRESSNNYTAINQFGFIGAFQFGAGALEDLGYLKSGVWRNNGRTNKGFLDPNNWTGKDGINSREDFLANTRVQDNAFKDYLQLNKKRLLSSGVISPGTPMQDVIGYVSAAHLLGSQGAQDLNSTDGNGTKGQEYFDLGKNAIENASFDSTLTLTSEERENFVNVIYNVAVREIEFEFDPFNYASFLEEQSFDDRKTFVYGDSLVPFRKISEFPVPDFLDDWAAVNGYEFGKVDELKQRYQIAFTDSSDAVYQRELSRNKTESDIGLPLAYARYWKYFS